MYICIEFHDPLPLPFTEMCATIAEAVGSVKVGEIIEGGEYMGRREIDPYADVDLDVSDVPTALAAAWSALHRLGAGPNTVIVEHTEQGEIIHRISAGQ
jgi:hypothetical protein